jgi:hypothetical protein
MASPGRQLCNFGASPNHITLIKQIFQMKCNRLSMFRALKQSTPVHFNLAKRTYISTVCRNPNENLSAFLIALGDANQLCGHSQLAPAARASHCLPIEGHRNAIELAPRTCTHKSMAASKRPECLPGIGVQSSHNGPPLATLT